MSGNIYNRKIVIPNQTKFNDYLDSAKRGFLSSLFNIGENLSWLIGANELSKELSIKAKENTRQQEFDTILDVNYLTDPEGATYDLANNAASMLSLAPMTFLVPGQAVAAGAGLFTSIASKLGPKVAKWISSPAVQKAVKTQTRNVLASTPEAFLEYSKTGKALDEKGAPSPRIKALPALAENIIIAPLANTAEFSSFSKPFIQSLSKSNENIAVDFAKSTLKAASIINVNILQSGIKGLFQQTFYDYTVGNPVGNPLSPEEWTHNQSQAFETGCLTSIISQGASIAYNSAKNRPLETQETVANVDSHAKQNYTISQGIFHSIEQPIQNRWYHHNIPLDSQGLFHSIEQRQTTQTPTTFSSDFSAPTYEPFHINQELWELYKKTHSELPTTTDYYQLINPYTFPNF